jgi:hypothetical protein
MIEEETRLARDALSAVLPYIAYPQELRELVETALQKSDNAQAFMENLKGVISGENDMTRKTDCRIFLSEFRRNASGKA